MESSQAVVLILGLSSALVGFGLRKVGSRSHAEARRDGVSKSLRFNLKAMELIGIGLIGLGVLLAVGAVLGAIFWPRP